MSGHVLCAGIHFDAGNDSRIGDRLNKGRAIFLLLPDRLVVENRATDALTETGSGDNQFPISATCLHSLGNSPFRKSFLAGWIAFIHRQQALVVGDYFPRDMFKLLRIHLGYSIASYRFPARRTAAGDDSLNHFRASAELASSKYRMVASVNGLKKVADTCSTSYPRPSRAVRCRRSVLCRT